MIVICNIRDQFQDLLPHFYKHYHRWGINRFVFGISGGKTNPAWKGVQDYNTIGAEVFLMETYNGPHNDHAEGKFTEEARLKYPEWYVPTDLDEFHEPLGVESFEDAMLICRIEKAKVVRSELRDRVAKNCEIPEKIDPDTDIFEQFPLNIQMTKTVMIGCCDKVCLAAPDVSMGAGHHHAPDYVGSSVKGVTFHFKWFGKVLEREREKTESRKKEGLHFAAEGERLIEFVKTHNGLLA